jgi:hypothetical protein
MLYIEKGEKSLLSKAHKEMNNLCAIIYDQLTEIFDDIVYKPLTLTSVKFRKGEGLEFQLNDPNIDLLEYLKDNNYNKELSSTLIKNITLAVVSDLINFVYESLNCAQRGKTTVAYALLRKPFKDELLILEHILGTPDDFVYRFFYDGEPDSYDPSKMTDDDKRLTISLATKKVDPFFFTEDFLYDFRYNKSFEAGISGFADHALHIVTTNKNYKTENQNFNFIFSGVDEIQRYWEHYYMILPFLLLYTTSVVDAIIFQYLSGPEAEKAKENKIIKRWMGYILWLGNTDSGKKKMPQLMRKLQGVWDIKCSICRSSKLFKKEDFEIFMLSDFSKCSNCRKETKFDVKFNKPDF